MSLLPVVQNKKVWYIQSGKIRRYITLFHQCCIFLIILIFVIFLKGNFTICDLVNHVIFYNLCPNVNNLSQLCWTKVKLLRMFVPRGKHNKLFFFATKITWNFIQLVLNYEIQKLSNRSDFLWFLKYLIKCREKFDVIHVHCINIIHVWMEEHDIDKLYFKKVYGNYFIAPSQGFMQQLNIYINILLLLLSIFILYEQNR